MPVCGELCQPTYPNYHLLVPDGEGGFYVTWTDDRSRTNADAYLQRITASGQPAPGWPAGGLALCALPRWQSPQAIALDGQGGVFVTWYDDRDAASVDTYVQRVQGDGSIPVGWPENGAQATAAISAQFPEAIAPDGTGGAYVVWRDDRDYSRQNYDVYAQRLTATGAVAEGWPVDGLPVCTLPGGQGQPSALPDGEGGVLIAWADCRGGQCDALIPRVDIYGLRLLPDGATAPGWTSNGLLLVSSRTAPKVMSDDAGGFYVACSTPAQLAPASWHWLYRFTLAGAPAEGWSPGGVQVCHAAGGRTFPSVAPDGLGGLLLAWTDYRGPGPAVIFAARILPDGSLPTGWTRDGVPISQILDGQSSHPEIVGDGMGGAYLSWEWADFATSSGVARVQHLTSQGAVAPGWAGGGAPVSTSISQYRPRPVADGAGGVMVLWEERYVGLYAQRFGADGPTPVLLSLASATATPERVLLSWYGVGAGTLAASVYRRDAASDWSRLGSATRDGPDGLRYEDRPVTAGARYAYRLGYPQDGLEQFTAETWVEVPIGIRLALEGFRPNPAVGVPAVAFSLANDEPASLEVVDIAGRRVLARALDGLGAGRHLLRLDEGRSLAPGVYLMRLRQGERTMLIRGAVIR